ncbi:MAG: mannose-6-phosphate isomerase, partial [Paludibacteraceae bacterium]|nr:mannose-6-phosphate isomerase [Paludibacteraceae bacterium]
LIEADTFIKFDYKRLDSFVIWICLEGSAIFASSKKHNQKIKQGETILFPACNLPTALIPEDDKIKLLEVYVG